MYTCCKTVVSMISLSGGEPEDVASVIFNFPLHVLCIWDTFIHSSCSICLYKIGWVDTISYD